MDLHQLTLKQAIQHLQKSADQVTGFWSTLRRRSDAIDQKVKAYASLSSDQITGSVNRPPLFGVPISIKDNICTAGWETCCGSKILKNFIPPYDATVISKLKQAGAGIFGKCNMDEFAFGSSTESSAFFITRNPWDLEHVPGGSSGGSAAAVAADIAVAALGSDTGGSIRQPASFCGVVGLKPTYGRVSRYGLIAFGSSLDQIGPITKTVEDSAILLGVIAGQDPKDSTSAHTLVPDYTKSLVKNVKGLKIGIAKEHVIGGLSADVNESFQRTKKVFQDLGAELIDISLPHTEHSVAVYYIVAVAEASSNLGRFDGVRFGLRSSDDNLRDMYMETRRAGFGAEAKRRILLGTFVLSAGYYDAYYLKGLKVRTLIKQDFDRAFSKADVILCPTAPTPAFRIHEKVNDPISMYLSDIFTIPANLAGIPAISFPAGFSKEGLPIGMQLMAKPFDEETLFRAAYTFEQATDFHTRRAKL